MPEPKLGHVFGVSKQRVLSYLERDAVDGLFKNAIDSDCHVVVYGSSKQGKTSLVDKNLPYSSNVVVSCTPKFGPVDIYKSILRQQNIRIESEEEKTTGTSTTASVAAKFKATLFLLGSGEGKVAGELSGSSGRSVRTETIQANLELPQEVADLLHRARFNKFVILENFHYLSFDVQKALAFDLRSFQELGIRFVILGVWREKNRLTQFNGDLQDRIIEVPVEPWSEREFRDVIRIGSGLLNVSISDKIVAQIIDGAFDSIGVVQELVKGVCLAAGIVEKQPALVTIVSMEFLETTLRQKLRTTRRGTSGH